MSFQKFTRENAKYLNEITSKFSHFRESVNLAQMVKNIATIETEQLLMRLIIDELMTSKTKQSELTSQSPRDRP